MVPPNMMVNDMFVDAEIEAIYQDVMGRAELAALRTVNTALEAIHHKSQELVPKGDPAEHDLRAMRAAGAPYPHEQLAERSQVVLASLEHPTGAVVYEGPYAAAQEAGVMEYEGRGGRPVEWHAEHFTTPGTGPHYLEDSLKMILAQIPEELAVQGRIAFGELPGVVMSKSSIQAAGRRQEFVAAPSGKLASDMRAEQLKVQSAPETAFVVPHPPTLQ